MILYLFILARQPKSKSPKGRHKDSTVPRPLPLKRSHQWWGLTHNGGIANASEEVSILLKHKSICTSENNFQHQHVTHCPRDGWRKRSIRHVWVAIHIWHHYVARITRVGGGPLVVQASIWMLSWENPKNNQRCIEFPFISNDIHQKNLLLLRPGRLYIKYLLITYCNWVIMLYFRLTVFMLSNGSTANQMFKKHVVQFTSTTDWCFYKNKCYSSNLICSNANKLDWETQEHKGTHTHLKLNC